MQVNFNTSFCNVTPNFGTLKKIDFVGDGLKNDYVAQKELLKIFDDKNVQELFENFDGEVTFTKTNPHDKRYALSYLDCSINLYDNYPERAIEVVDKYKEKAKIMGFSEKEIKNMDFSFDTNNNKINYLNKRVEQNNVVDTTSDLAKNLVKSVLYGVQQRATISSVINQRANQKIKNLDTCLSQMLIKAKQEKQIARENSIAQKDVRSILKRLLG